LSLDTQNIRQLVTKNQMRIVFAKALAGQGDEEINIDWETQG